jgi:NodT family efflux transporter outer membrane factor (OMF) lipoprotein
MNDLQNAASGYPTARHAAARMAMLVSVSLVAGCTVGPNFTRPDKPPVEGYTPESLMPQTASAASNGGASQQFVPGRDIPGQWWVLFRSEQLNVLINEALRANPDLAAAQATLRQANENLYAQQGSLFPTFNANGSAQQTRQSGASLGEAGTSLFYGVTAASLSVSYNIDTFGGVRRQVESQAALAQNQRFQLEATYLTLTSNVVVAAVNLASLQAQITATEGIIKLETDALGVVQRQFDLGGASRADVLLQQATLEQTRGTLPPLQKQLAIQRNQMMTLVGRFPSQNAGESFDLQALHLPEELPLSLPSQLVEQRPDVRAAEAQLHAASADVGVAIANQLPQLGITGQYGLASGGFNQIFLPGSIVWNLVGNILQPLFDGGRLEHLTRAARAGLEASAARYRSTVLTAFQDVANALRALQSDADALRVQVAAEQAARGSLDLATQQYQLGAINYVTLLNAQQTYQTAVINRLKAQAARYSDTAALFQALGGGWWNRADVDPASIGKPDVFWVPPVQEIKLPAAGR